MEQSVYYDRSRDYKEHIYFHKNISNEKSSSVVLHNHHAIELKFIISGQYAVSVGDEKHICKEGDIIFVNSRRPHAYESIGESVNYVLVVGQDFIKSICPKGKALPVYMPASENFAYIKRILEETYPVWNKMNNFMQRGFVFRLLGTIMQYNGVIDVRYDKKEELAVQILEYIDLHFNEDINLEDLSKLFGYTPNYFSNIFNKYLHMGLRECVNRARIKKAIELLKNNNRKTTMLHVAEACGYDSPNTFHRAYKKYAKDGILFDS